jgi:protein involved in polysaccharide export with SLBB domain
VLGTVVRPGVYGLRSESDTILDLLSHAGGIAPGADPLIHLIPAEPVESSTYEKLAINFPANLASGDGSALLLKKTEPIIIDLQELAYGGFQEYLSLPVRPGDVIMVPGGGQILVDGWVNKPGAYNVTPGMTVSGIVAAAGGLLYPADASAVKIIRTERGGKKNVITSDLEKIRGGQEIDIRLQSGDLVEIGASNDKLVLYGLYRFFTTVVNVAVGANIPMFR